MTTPNPDEIRAPEIGPMEALLRALGRVATDKTPGAFCAFDGDAGDPAAAGKIMFSLSRDGYGVAALSELAALAARDAELATLRDERDTWERTFRVAERKADEFLTKLDAAESERGALVEAVKREQDDCPICGGEGWVSETERGEEGPTQVQTPCWMTAHRIALANLAPAAVERDQRIAEERDARIAELTNALATAIAHLVAYTPDVAMNAIETKLAPVMDANLPTMRAYDQRIAEEAVAKFREGWREAVSADRERIRDAVAALNMAIDDTHPEGCECDICRAADALDELLGATR